MQPLSHDMIFGNWATLLLPVNEDDSIDYGALATEIDTLIAYQVNGIYSNGTAGEFYTQTEAEFDRVSHILAEKCNRAGMPFQLGCSHMSPQISLERLRRIVSLRPGAVQVILPDWFPPTMLEIIDFLQRMQDAAGGIGLVLYNPPHAKLKIQPADFQIIANAGIRLAGCKTAGGDENWYLDMKKYADRLSYFIPGHHLATGVSRGAHGAYSNVACLHPCAAQDWYEQMLTDMPAALELEGRIQAFMKEYIIPYITDEKYSNQAVDKLMAAIGGWAPVSARLRWPYRSVPNEDAVSIRRKAKELLPEFLNTYHEQN